MPTELISVGDRERDTMEVTMYFYWRGVVLNSLGRHEEAVDAFRTVFYIPAAAVTPMLVHACRMYLLTSILATGRVRAVCSRANLSLNKNQEPVIFACAGGRLACVHGSQGCRSAA
jgi:hypothetical protein